VGKNGQKKLKREGGGIASKGREGKGKENDTSDYKKKGVCKGTKSDEDPKNWKRRRQMLGGDVIHKKVTLVMGQKSGK